MVGLLPVVFALALASSRRDLARCGRRSAATPAAADNTPGRPASTSASPVKAKDDANNTSQASAAAAALGDGAAFDWFTRGGGRHGFGLEGGKTRAAGAAAGQSVSLFGPEEKELDRYSAAFAATHFLRQERDRVIKDTTNPLAHVYLSITKPGQHNRWMSTPWISEEARQAQKDYLLQAGNIIRSNGLTTNRYNQLSHILGKRKDLRGRVQHQAYLYRVNADLRGTKIRPLPDPVVVGTEGDATAPTSRRSKDERREIVNLGQQVKTPRTGPPPDKNMLFAKSLREIEALRFRQRRRLMKEVGSDDLPSGLCRPEMGRIASPRIRKECQSFPVTAETIVTANGLEPEEFNRLSARSRDNMLYRWQVLRCVRKLENRGRAK